MYTLGSRFSIAIAALAISAIAASALAVRAADTHRTPQFQGPKANTGFVTHVNENGKSVLTLSDDFVVPDTPDPHWQLVDSRGRVYLMQRLTVKPDRLNKSIEVPEYVPDVKSVQIWCAWAETVLGETSFEAPVK